MFIMSSLLLLLLGQWKSILLGKMAFKHSLPALLLAPPICSQHLDLSDDVSNLPASQDGKAGTALNPDQKTAFPQIENASAGCFPEDDALSQTVQVLCGHWQATWPWAGCLTSLHPRFLFCSVGVIVTALHTAIVRSKCAFAAGELSTMPGAK